MGQSTKELAEAIVLSTGEGALVNYHPTRKLLPEMSASTVTFALGLGLRYPKAFRIPDPREDPKRQIPQWGVPIKYP